MEGQQGENEASDIDRWSIESTLVHLSLKLETHSEKSNIV